MQIEIDPRLIDEAVFWKMRPLGSHEPGARKISAEHHRKADPIYKMSNAAERELRFNALNRDTFYALELMKPIEEVLEYFPLFREGLINFVLGYAFRKTEEEADLFRDSEGLYNSALKVKAQTLIDPSLFMPLAYHELSHVSDMLNPEFQFQRDIHFSGDHPAHRDMLRERYRLLWDIHIDSRLNAFGKPFPGTKDRYARMFSLQFGVSPILSDVFERLWCGNASNAKHADWVQAAESSSSLFRIAGLPTWTHVDSSAERKFASACPVCKCPTSSWAENTDRLPQMILNRIKNIVPYWTSGLGLCKQCEEILRIEPVATR